MTLLEVASATEAEIDYGSAGLRGRSFFLPQDDGTGDALREPAEARSACGAWSSAASCRRLQLRSGGSAPASDCRCRCAKRDRFGGIRAEILRIRAPVQRLIAERYTQIARAA